MFPALAITLDHPPAQPVWLLLAAVLATTLGSTAAIVAATYARTTDGAAVVALPIFAALFFGGVWATFVPLGDITWRMRATGGGALTELVRIGWEGPADGAGIVATAAAAGASLLVLLTLTVVLALAATRTFRWNPAIDASHRRGSSPGPRKENPPSRPRSRSPRSARAPGFVPDWSAAGAATEPPMRTVPNLPAHRRYLASWVAVLAAKDRIRRIIPDGATDRSVTPGIPTRQPAPTRY